MATKLKLGIVGLGGRGYGLLKSELVKHKDIEVVAVCDSYADRAEKGSECVVKHGGNKPLVTVNYKDIIAIKGLDILFISTAWEDHIAIAIEAMEAGIFVAMEVGGAYKLQDCFDLVACYERTGTHCMMLENCCYGEYELMVLNMVRKGLFGEIVHCSGGYMHDLRNEISNGEKNRHYRLRNYLNRNCENYPTHELGPIAKVLNINRGNLMVKLTSHASKARGLHEYITNKKADDKELCNAVFKQGDIVTTVIETINGETITLVLDTTLPRTYSRGFTVRGTKMMYSEDNNMLFVDGKHNVFDFKPSLIWGNGKKYRKKHKHPLWANRLSLISKGHGGMDNLVIRAMADCVINKTHPPIDVYDTAAWMAVTCLSEDSIKQGGMPVDFPDFTGGKWKDRKDVPVGKYSLE